MADPDVLEPDEATPEGDADESLNAELVPDAPDEMDESDDGQEPEPDEPGEPADPEGG